MVLPGSPWVRVGHRISLEGVDCNVHGFSPKTFSARGRDVHGPADEDRDIVYRVMDFTVRQREGDESIGVFQWLSAHLLFAELEYWEA